MKAWPVLGISVIEVILLLAHWFLFHTWIEFWDAPSISATLALRIVLLLLAFSFVAAALLSFRFSNPLVVVIYKFAAVWLGFLNYLFFAACLSWLAWYAWLALRLARTPRRHDPGSPVFSLRWLCSLGFMACSTRGSSASGVSL